MRNYWSCSKFADWLRGSAKPYAATGKGWNDWQHQAAEDFPIRYWIAEEGLDKLQDIIRWPVEVVSNIKYYINNRWISRSHALTAHAKDIKPGQWCDVGRRFLPCLFNELVDFVEIEQAWHHIAWDTEARKKFNPPFWAYGWFHWRVWRCPAAGIDYLHWAMSLTNNEDLGYTSDHKDYGKSTQQAEAAKEIFELYTWWTKVYPNRPDPMDVSGWSALCDRRREEKGADFLWEDKTEEENAETAQVLDLCHKIEQAQEKEDEEMLIRLIRVRHNLWT